MAVAMTGGFGALPSSLKDKQRQAVLRLLNFNSSDNGECLGSQYYTLAQPDLIILLSYEFSPSLFRFLELVLPS